jgi:hypothetical protein
MLIYELTVTDICFFFGSLLQINRESISHKKAKKNQQSAWKRVKALDIPISAQSAQKAVLKFR